MLLNTLIYLTFIFLSLGQIGRISLLDGQVNFYLYEVLMVVLFATLFIKYRLAPIYESFKKFKVFYFFAFFLLFSLLINLSGYKLLENGVAFLYFLRLIFYFIYFFYLSFFLKQTKKSHVLSWAMMFFMAFTIMTSIAQYFLYPDLRNLFYLGWDPHLYRLFGLFFDTSLSGAIYGMSFLLIMLDCRNISKVFKTILLGIFLIFIVLTFSRSLYIAFGLTMFFIFIRNKNWAGLGILTLIFILLILVVPKPSGEGVNLGRLFSINSRLANYNQAIALWKKKPILGVGYNHIRYARDSFAQGNAGASYHSSFLIILVTGGTLGLLGWLGVLGKMMKRNAGTTAMIIFLSLLSLTDNILLHPFVLFYLLSAILLFDKRR